MLRHACGYALANAGHDTRRIQDWLAHRSIQHTTRYTQFLEVCGLRCDDAKPIL
jgi:site-specific recombinase XerD